MRQPRPSLHAAQTSRVKDRHSIAWLKPSTGTLPLHGWGARKRSVVQSRASHENHEESAQICKYVSNMYLVYLGEAQPKRAKSKRYLAAL